jgi:hypothetical protein
MQEIMSSGKPIPDPGGAPGAVRWDVAGVFGKSSGTWQLVYDPEADTVLHLLLKSSGK